MLQNPLINTRGRFGAGAGAARGHPFLVGAGAGAGAYLRFPRPLTPEKYYMISRGRGAESWRHLLDEWTEKQCLYKRMANMYLLP